MESKEMTTRDSILLAAKNEFLAKGYQATGLREIARKAGVTTGAFYGYFKSKDEVFDALVGTQYHHMLDMYRSTLNQFAQLPAQEQASSMEDYTRKAIRVMTDYLYDNHDAFKLILCCSEGTGYSDLVHVMAQLDVDATHEFSQTSGQAGMPLNPVNPMLEHILTSSMFTAYFELIVHDVPRQEAETYIDQLLLFYSAGWQQIMGM